MVLLNLRQGMLTVWLCGINFIHIMLEQRTAQVRQLQSMKLVTMSQLTNSFSVDAQTVCHILLVWDCLVCSQISGMRSNKECAAFYNMCLQLASVFGLR